MNAFTPVVLVTILGILLPARADPAVLPMASFPESAVPIADWMDQNGWETQRGNPREFTVSDGTLKLVSEGDSVAIGNQRAFPKAIDTWSELRFRFRVTTVPEGTNLKRKSGDDAAFRIYVAFDRDKGWFSPPHTIAYTWSEDVPAGTLIQSPHFENLRYLSLGSGAPSDWMTVERDLVADYRKVFPEAADLAAPDLAGLLLKCDSNNTRSSASAELAFIELLPASR